MRRIVAPTALVTGCLVLVSCALSLTGCSGTTNSAVSAGETGPLSAATTTTAPSSADASHATGTGAVAATTLPAVRVGSTAGIDEHVGVTVLSISDVKVTGSGPGEVAGTAVVVRLQVRNDGTQPVDLAKFTVNASTKSGTPASPSDASPARPLSGTLTAGHSATGVYVFTLARSARRSVRIDVSSGQFARVVIVAR